jgi:hypothetical protein
MASIVSRRPFMEVNPGRNLPQSLPLCRPGPAEDTPSLLQRFSAEVRHG